MINSIQRNVIIAHLIFFTQLYFYGWAVALLMIVVSWIVLNITISLYIHRIRCHRNFNMKTWKHHLFSFIFSGLNLGSPSVYVSVHLNHHKHSGTDDDPHDPYTRGFWNILFSNWDSKFKPDRKKLKEEKSLPYFKFYHENHQKISLAFCIFLPVLPMLAFWHTKFVTIIVHLKNVGYQNYITNETSRNIWWLKPLLWGEELHNNHHAKWVVSNHNHKNNWKELDILYLIGCLISDKI